MVFSQGVCCGDDAYHAMVAKNLAEGRGYASSLPIGQTHSTLTLFDPLLGTGPTMILPTALMIALFGNAYWVPGLTNVIIWSALILCIGVVLNRIVSNKVGLTISVVLFFLFAYLFTAYHFELWYALFGDIPTALLIILAILIYFFHDSKIYLAITGVLFSLAFESKMVAVLPFITFILFIVLYHLITNRYQLKTAIKKIFSQLLFILIGFCIPIFLFEAYRVISLHRHGYLVYWQQAIEYIRTAGVVANKSLLTTISERTDLAIRRFGLFLPIIFPILAYLGYVLWSDKRLLAIYIAFAGLIVVYTFYWLVLSEGWARYFVISLILFVFALALPFTSDTLKTKFKVIYAIVLAGLIFYNMSSIDTLIQFRTPQLFRPSSSTRAMSRCRAPGSRVRRSTSISPLRGAR